MERQADANAAFVASGRPGLRPLLLTALFASASLLLGCETSGESSAGRMARIVAPEFDQEDAHPGSVLSNLLTFAPYGGALAGAVIESVWKAADPPERFTYAVRIVRLDGQATAITQDEMEVPAGEHSLAVKYCRYGEDRSLCSDPAEVTFLAEAGESYRLQRNRNFRVEVIAEHAWTIVARSETKVGVIQDQEKCVELRQTQLKQRKLNGLIDEAEAQELKAAAPAQCHAWVWGDGEEPK